MTTKKEIDDLTYAVIGCAIEVHKELGPGLLESVYEMCLIEELEYKKIKFFSQFEIPVYYKHKKLEAKFRLDLLVEGCLIVELKAVEAILNLHHAQVMSYMKMMQKPKGLLINFNCNNIVKEGQRTFVNNIYSELL